MTVGVATLHSDAKATSISAPPCSRSPETATTTTRWHVVALAPDVDILNSAAAAAAAAAGGVVVYMC